MGKGSTDFEIRQKISLSQQVQGKDNEYGLFAGADLKTAIQSSRLVALKKSGVLPKKYWGIVDLILLFNDLKRKAFFASTSSEISKLGFILGMNIEELDFDEDEDESAISEVP